MPSTTTDASGLLLMVATPIGNLGDISLRAQDALEAADLIVAEDTRRTRKLLSYLGIDKPIESFHAHSNDYKLDGIIVRLQRGETVAYVSDAGTPTVSDPGAELAKASRAAGVTVSPIPGPSAITAALSASGMNADRFIFLGYPPRKAGPRLDFFRLVLAESLTVVLYEAPHRIAKTLRELAVLEAERYAVIGREMTKKFEQFIPGTLAELARYFADNEPRGEFVILLEGAATQPSEPVADETVIESVLSDLLASGLSVGDAADAVAKLTTISRRRVYRMAVRAAQR